MKNHLKAICSLLIICLLTTALAGCGEVRMAEILVHGMFAAYKALDWDEANKYVSIDDLIGALYESGNGDDSGEETDMERMERIERIEKMYTVIMSPIADKLSYRVIFSERKDDSTVMVKTEITSADIAPALTEIVAYVFISAFLDSTSSDEETSQKYEEILKKDFSETEYAVVTNTVDISVVKTEDNTWKIKPDYNLANAIFGGLGDAFKDFENTLDSSDGSTDVTTDPNSSPTPSSVPQNSPIPTASVPQNNPIPTASVSNSSSQSNGNYLFDSDKNYITENYLNTQSQEQVRLILNEMYARHGYIFTLEQYKSYFSSKPWYTPKYTSAEDAEKNFNSVEMKNKETIVAYEKSKGWR